MNKFDWHTHSLKELSTVLTNATVIHSEAIGDSVLYQITHQGVEKLAISLPGEKALIIELRPVTKNERRRPSTNKETT